MSEPIPVILVLGATASGKSGLAIELAKALDGEIISADALAVYEQMDIGTAKPSMAERQGIPHHCLDCIAIGQYCDVSRWFEMANDAMGDIHKRGKRIIIAGGSPLYTKLFVEGISAGPPRDASVRKRLEQAYDEHGGQALLDRLCRVDPEYGSQRHVNDKRRIVRALECYDITGKPYSSFHTTDGGRREDIRTLMFALRWDKERLHNRINARAKMMFKKGLIEEVKALRDKLSPEALQGVGYKEVCGYLDGEYDLEHAIYLVQRGTRHLAKHQHTWYRRFRDLVWLPGDADDLVAQATTRSQAFLNQ